MRSLCLLLLLGCGGAAAPVLSLGGTYPTTVVLLPGNTCGTVEVQPNVTTVAHAAGAASLTLTHASITYAGTVDQGGAFAVPAAAHGAFTIGMTGQFSTTGLTATVQVTQQQPACGYSVSWAGTKNGPPNTIP